ncbi:piggyBac transposable element-derived protein 3-like [Stylophora pistillata]|nr:piggyBac transposable element-derived protein 3-like [Stylophora pistillata]
MASRYTSLDEIHGIIFDAPDDSDDSIHSWDEDSNEEISDPHEAEDVQNQNLQRDFGNEEMHSTSEIRVPTQNRNRSSGKRQTVPEINWGDLDEVVNVAYPEFSGPQHGPVHSFDVDSEPVVFFDQLFTDELWDLLVTKTNRYARQANVNNWVDTTQEEIRCFIGFLFGTSINKNSQLDDIWSSDWVVASPAFAHFFTRDRFWALLSNIHLADNEKSVDRNHQDYDKLYKIRPMVTILKQSFQTNYSLGQNVSVDEAVVKGKGRNPVKQYMPMKPKKRGSKLWCIGCSCCAHLWDFQLYAGKEKGTAEQG